VHGVRASVLRRLLKPATPKVATRKVDTRKVDAGKVATRQKYASRLAGVGSTQTLKDAAVLLFLATGPRRSLRLKLSDTRVYEPYTRARLGNTAHSCKLVVLRETLPTLDQTIKHSNTQSNTAERKGNTLNDVH